MVRSVASLVSSSFARIAVNLTLLHEPIKPCICSVYCGCTDDLTPLSYYEFSCVEYVVVCQLVSMDSGF